MSAKPPRLDVTTARLFVAAVEHGSIVDAAREERIAASALSKRIRLLEMEVGVPLLRRHRRGVEATSVGMIVLRRARAVLHEVRQLDADLAAVREGLSGRVVLCANETALTEFVPRILPEFVAEHPGVEIVLDERQSSAVVRAIWQNAADIGIYVGDVPPIDLWRRPVFRDRLVLVTCPGHPISEKAAVSMEDILKYEIVGQATEGALSTLLTRAASVFHQILKMRLFADGYNTVCKIVSCGLAVGVVSESSARIFGPQMDLVVLPILDDWAKREHQVCVRSIRNLAAPQRALLEHLLQRSGIDTW